MSIYAKDNLMIFYQIKAIRKNTKPPIWRRAFVPDNITFTQLAIVLQKLLNIPETPSYEFEFYASKIRFIEWDDTEDYRGDYYYSYISAQDTYINDYLDNEKWFNFKTDVKVFPDVTGRNRECFPDYRIEIENKVSNLKSPKNGVMTSTDYPLLVKEKVLPDDEWWTDAHKTNSIFGSKFKVSFNQQPTYKNFYELLADISKGSGLVAAQKPQSRTDRIKRSSDSYLKEIVGNIEKLIGNNKSKVASNNSPEELGARKENVISGKAASGAIAITSPKRTVRKDTLEDFLKTFEKEELLKEAKRIDCHLVSSRIDKMAFELARFLLEPATMRRLLYSLSEESLDAFENLFDKGRVKAVGKQWDLLEPIYDLNYILAYEDDTVIVPDQVQFIYSILLKNGYRQLHQKTRWFMDCNICAAIIYSVAPVDIVYKMYNQGIAADDTMEDFLKHFDTCMLYDLPCTIIDGLVIYKELLKEQIYKKVEQDQRPVDFYIPPVDELKDISKNGYPSQEKSYKDLKEFCITKLNVTESKAERLCKELYDKACFGLEISEYRDILEKEGISIDSDKQLSRFMNLVMDANNNSRMFVLRGHTPNELANSEISFYPDRPTKIVPMSTDAASILAKGNDILASMGIEADLESNATEIDSKKVYPNDPCPCGSEKKYKKCCGKNK